MRDLAIECARRSARAHVSSWCSAMTAALVLTLAPVPVNAALAQAPEPDAEPPDADAGAPEPDPDAPEPDADAPEDQRSWEEPVDIVPPEEPEDEAPEPGADAPEDQQPEDEQPAGEPGREDPNLAGQDGPSDLTEVLPDPALEQQRAKAKRMRKAGVGLMASGGAVATTGLGLTIAYTILGDREEEVEEPVPADVQQKADIAQVGGILLASGIAIAAIGGIVLIRGRKQAEARPVARLRVVPALGGVLVTGRF